MPYTQTMNFELQTLSPELNRSNPKPQTPNPSPKTPIPKPQTQTSQEKIINLTLSGSGVCCMNASPLLRKIMLCSKYYCPKVSNCSFPIKCRSRCRWESRGWRRSKSSLALWCPQSLRLRPAPQTSKPSNPPTPYPVLGVLQG